MHPVDYLRQQVPARSRNRGPVRGQRQILADVVVQAGGFHPSGRRAGQRDLERRRFSGGIRILGRRQRHRLPVAPVRRLEDQRGPALHRQVGVARQAAHADHDVRLRRARQAHEEPAFPALAHVKGRRRHDQVFRQGPRRIHLDLRNADGRIGGIGQAREAQVANGLIRQRPIFPAAMVARAGIRHQRPVDPVRGRIDAVLVAAVGPVPIQQAQPRHRGGGLQIHGDRSRRRAGPNRIAVTDAGGVHPVDPARHQVAARARDRRAPGQVLADVVVQGDRLHDPGFPIRARDGKSRRFIRGVAILGRRQRHRLPDVPIRGLEDQVGSVLDGQGLRARAAFHVDFDVLRGLTAQAHEEAAFAGLADVEIGGRQFQQIGIFHRYRQGIDPVHFPFGQAHGGIRGIGQAGEPQVPGDLAGRVPVLPPAVFPGTGVHQRRPRRAIHRGFDPILVDAAIPVPIQQAHARHRHRRLQVQRDRSGRGSGPHGISIVGIGRVHPVDHRRQQIAPGAGNPRAVRSQREILPDVVVQRPRLHDLVA